MISRAIMVLSALLFSFASQAMEGDLFKRFGLGKGGVISPQELQKIQENMQIKKAWRKDTAYAEVYLAELINGDTIVCSRFHKGTMSGRVDCTKAVSSKEGRTKILTLSPDVFPVIKLLAEHSQALK